MHGNAALMLVMNMYLAVLWCGRVDRDGYAIPECSFPGSGVYTGTLHLLRLSSDHAAFVDNDR